MKRMMAILLVLMVSLAGQQALAVQSETAGRLIPIEATATQKLALRTGPGTKYEEIFTLPVSGVRDLQVMEQEKGGTVMWAMLDFDSDYGRYRAYTGMKRIDAKGVPKTQREGRNCCIGKKDVYAYYGPGKDYVRFEEKIPAHTQVIVYHEESGYVMADYIMPDAKPQQRDKELLQITRGWIPVEALENYEAVTQAPESDK